MTMPVPAYLATPGLQLPDVPFLVRDERTRLGMVLFHRRTRLISRVLDMIDEAKGRTRDDAERRESVRQRILDITERLQRENLSVDDSFRLLVEKSIRRAAAESAL